MEQIKLQSLTLRTMRMKMREPFTTSFGTEYDKQFLLITLRDSNGIEGWGECVAMEQPIYNEETNVTAAHIIRDYLVPLLKQQPLAHPRNLSVFFSAIRGNRMAKAAIECAYWDLYARRNNIPLYQALGGTRKTIDVGISIGIQSTTDVLLNKVAQYLSEGYKRIKVKIMPNFDVQLIDAVRARYPDIPLMADANSAYTLADIDLLKQLDDYNLMMIEQPLGCDDIIDHAQLQRIIKTPICLDESIHTCDDARRALSIHACGIINIKLGRVGGLGESLAIEQLCRARGIPVWCGGMLEAGIGRAFNVALTTLTGFTLPGDTAASSRYWKHDIITPEVTVQNGQITVSEQPGLGYAIDMQAVEHYTEHKEVIALTAA